jgi:hypothetical protein
MELVVNEWLPEYLRGDADLISNAKAIQFLNKFMQKDDMLTVKFGSPFTDKIYKYQSDFGGFPIVSKNFNVLSGIIFRDLQKTRIIYADEVQPIPAETHNLLHTPGTNYYSDYYLFEAAHLTESKIIITTDVKLRDFMSADPNFKIVLLEDFLRTY